MTYHAQVTADRQVVLPDELAEELGLTPGNALVIEREDGKLVLKSYEQVVREVQTEFRAMMPADYTGSLVDDLIAERREEARREDELYQEWLDSKSAK